MASFARGGIDIPGLDALVAKLRGNEIYAAPWRKALVNITGYAVGRARARAPRMTNTTWSSVTSRMDKSPIPLWTVVTAGAESKKGFRYPFALNAGRATRKGREVTFHYRGTGKPTRGWFSGVLGMARRVANSELEAARAAIEAAWGR